MSYQKNPAMNIFTSITRSLLCLLLKIRHIYGSWTLELSVTYVATLNFSIQSLTFHQYSFFLKMENLLLQINKGLFCLLYTQICQVKLFWTYPNVIYVPKLNANILSIGHMTNSNIDVNFSKNHSYLSMDDEILAYGPKISKLFTYTTMSTSKENHSILYAGGPSESTLWHHMLTHTN